MSGLMTEPFVTSTGYQVFCDAGDDDPYVTAALKYVEDKIGRKLTKNEIDECTAEAIKGKQDMFRLFWPKPVKYESELTDEERAEFEAWLNRGSDD